MDNAKKRLLISRLLLFVSVFFIFVAGWLIGTQIERSQTQLDLSKFWRVYSLVTSKFSGDVDEEKAVDGAIKGLVESLDDPYSAYLNNKEYLQLEEDLNGKFEGIGAVLTQKDDKVIVVEPIEDSPAIRAGLLKDDHIIAVDGSSVSGETLEEIVNKIRGPKGTEVTLTVVRAGKEVEIKITRDSIDIKTVSFEKRESTGIIRITQFSNDTSSGVREAIIELEKLGVDNYLIDLRDNPGGFLNIVPIIAGYFLPPGTIVVKQSSQGTEGDVLRTTGAPLVPSKPIYVYLNGGSASASEILAGALKDHGRATLLGEKSFGKGSVQDILNLRGGTALRLTVSEWLTPNGQRINKVGIEPDHQIEADDQEQEIIKALEFISTR